ncbi:hypothetical protein, partial [Amaricoccus sp.]|uniref:hypothetical protein n=1 Tax=Amaricoccus sp. TaxID=1872485 RepID=UPI002601EDEB
KGGRFQLAMARIPGERSTITALEGFLRPHVALGKSRLETRGVVWCVPEWRCSRRNPALHLASR